MTKRNSLKDLLTYDHQTGELIWKISTSPRGPLGTPAGWINNVGHKVISIKELGLQTTLARAVWMYFNGALPSGRLQFINGNKLDTRIENLRLERRGELTADLLKEEVRYDKDSGLFYAIKIKNRTTISSIHEPLGWLSDQGYVMISVLGRVHRAHRLAWLYTHGQWPDGEIDHINGITTDNRISNLRTVDRVGNMGNIKRPSTNTSGYKGVSWSRGAKKWMAQIKHDNTHHYLGLFECPKQAHEAYLEASERLRGFRTYRSD